MKVAVLANLKSNAPRADVSSDAWDDLDGESTIDGLVAALRSGGHDAAFFESSLAPPHRLIERLRAWRPEICFNIAEGHWGESRESLVPTILDELRIRYTGSGPLTLALALDKPMTKRILNYHELPTPEFQVFGRPDEEINDDLVDGDRLRFPLFVKPSREGTGIGVSARSIVHTVEELIARVSHMLATYRQPVLVERFITGREITVGVVGNLGPTAPRRLNDRTAPRILPEGLTVLPPLEVNSDAYDASEAGIYTNRIKVELADAFHYTCPARLDPSLADELSRLAAAVFRVIGCHDVARIDFRVENGVPWILEINPLPGLNREYSDLCIEARAHGWEYERLVNTILDTAITRRRAETGAPATQR